MSDGREDQRKTILPGRIDLRVECPVAATLLVKETYHPNWRFTVDGRVEQAFMVSPSLIGVDMPAGVYEVQAEYLSPAYKNTLHLLGACTLIAAVLGRRQFDRLEGLLRASRDGDA